MNFARIFRPGVGQTHKTFIAAFCNNTNSSGTDAMYRGDFVYFDTTAPTAQGPTAGTLEGKTIGAYDYVYVALGTGTLSCAQGAGFVEGNTIGDRVTTTAMANDSCIIVQNWGVMGAHCHVNTATAIGDIFVGNSATAGEVTCAVPVAASATTGVLGGYVYGFALTTDAAYTRGAVTTIKGCTGFIRSRF